MPSNIENADFGTQGEIPNCRVLDIGLDGYAECLKEGPNLCKHAVPFGYCFLCHHPKVNEIIKHMQDAQAVSPGEDH